MELSNERVSGPAGERTVVVVSGDLDLRTAPQLRALLVDLVAGGWHDLVVDLRAVATVDATGLGVLLGGVSRTQQHGGSLRLVCTRPALLRVLRITGLTGLLPVHPSLPDALAGGGAAASGGSAITGVLPRPRAPRRDVAGAPSRLAV